MCKRCSRYIDLKDYNITSAVSKNFKTKGSFTIEPTGYVFNTEAMVQDAAIKGRFLGKLTAWGSLTIFSSAEIRGTFKANNLVIPAMNHFRWKDTIAVSSAEIAARRIGCGYSCRRHDGRKIYGAILWRYQGEKPRCGRRSGGSRKHPAGREG